VYSRRLNGDILRPLSINKNYAYVSLSRGFQILDIVNNAKEVYRGKSNAISSFSLFKLNGADYLLYASDYSSTGRTGRISRCLNIIHPNGAPALWGSLQFSNNTIFSSVYAPTVTENGLGLIPTRGYPKTEYLLHIVDLEKGSFKAQIESVYTEDCAPIVDANGNVFLVNWSDTGPFRSSNIVWYDTKQP
jgi:hypothetical protein